MQPAPASHAPASAPFFTAFAWQAPAASHCEQAAVHAVVQHSFSGAGQNVLLQLPAMLLASHVPVSSLFLTAAGVHVPLVAAALQDAHASAAVLHALSQHTVSATMPLEQLAGVASVAPLASRQVPAAEQVH